LAFSRRLQLVPAQLLHTAVRRWRQGREDKIVESHVAVHPDGMMKAIVQEGYGSAEVLRLREIDKPVLTDDRVLVRVRAASVNALI